MPHPLSKISAALAAASVVAITQILTTKPDFALTGAVWLFAVCLPLLVLISVRPGVDKITGDLNAEETKAFKRFMLVALGDILGFVFVFFHFGPIPGALFFASFLLALAGFTNWKTVRGFGYILFILPVVNLQGWARRMFGRAS